MANIIDAFLVTLGLDTSDYKKGVAESEEGQKAIRDSATKTATHMKEQGHNAGEFFTEMIAKAGEFLGIMMTVEGLKSFAEKELEAEDAGVKLARMMDLNVQELQGWQRAVKLEGGSAEDFNSSLRRVTSSLALIAIHGPRAKMALRLFAGLGIQEEALKGKNAIQVFEMLAEKMHGMSGGMALGLGMRLGLSEGTIRLLMKGKEGVAELVEEEKKLGTYTEEDGAKAELFNDSMENVKTQFSMVGQKILVLLMPALQMMANALLAIGAWAKEHPQIIQAGIAGIVAAVIALSVALVPLVIELLPIELITLAIAAAVGLVTAGVVYLAAEWNKWAHGGKSSLAGLFQFLYDIWNLIRGHVMVVIGFVKEIFLAYVQTIKDEFMFFYYLFTGQWSKAGDKFKDVLHDLSKVFLYIVKYLYYNFWTFIYEMKNLWSDAWKSMEAKALETVSRLSKFLTDHPILANIISPVGYQAAKAYEARAQEASAGESVAGGHGAPMSSSAVSHKTVSVGMVEIHTAATDAHGIASTIGPAIYSHALIDHADGGM
jgi:hypothetical protein